MPTTREEALAAVGRYGKANQYEGQNGPYWYGKIAEVHSGGDYMLFERRHASAKWYHRRDVHLHPVDQPENDAPAATPVAKIEASKGKENGT